MRPRQSSLGIAPIQERSRALKGASMRPRQSSLGIPYGKHHWRWPVISFNEAEAIKPRNLRRRSQ